ncbi:MAG: glycosyltransferase [Tannerellaceae bacterium]|jgi:GT2 family glycosyltransferase|nr:glycosyltransferase [Tannerellaceae bacterium]
MNIKLFFERLYWAFFKRTGQKKQKSYEDWAAKGYKNTPEVSFIVQSHNKSNAVIHIVKELRKFPDAEIVVIDDGSTLEHTRNLASFLIGGNEFMIRANDLYENVMYDKAIRFANGTYVVLLQDDDRIPGTEWVSRAVNLFRKYPDMVILGGLNGLNIYPDEENKWLHVKEYTDRNIYDKEFRFVHSVNRAPMLINKPLYMEHLKHIEFSFAPFQCDDTELCLRAWLAGLKVGRYNAVFDSLMAGGMRIWNSEFMNSQGRKNHRKLYDMYAPSLDRVTALVEEANSAI